MQEKMEFMKNQSQLDLHRLEERVVDLSWFNLFEMLGEWGFGYVHRAEMKKGLNKGIFYAIKV